MAEPVAAPPGRAIMAEPVAAPPVARPSLKERMKALFDEYGPVAIGVYFAIFFLVIGGFALAISFGVKVEGTAGTAGTLAAAWVAAKLTQPLRILATLVLTPFVGKFVQRFRKPKPPTPTATP